MTAAGGIVSRPRDVLQPGGIKLIPFVGDGESTEDASEAVDGGFEVVNGANHPGAADRLIEDAERSECLAHHIEGGAVLILRAIVLFGPRVNRFGLDLRDKSIATPCDIFGEGRGRVGGAPRRSPLIFDGGAVGAIIDGAWQIQPTELERRAFGTRGRNEKPTREMRASKVVAIHHSVGAHFAHVQFCPAAHLHSSPQAHGEQAQAVADALGVFMDATSHGSTMASIDL